MSFARKPKTTQGSKNSGLSFIALPIVFAVVTAAAVFFVVQPVAQPYVEIARFLMSDSVEFVQNKPASSNMLSDMDQIPYSSLQLPQEGEQYARITISGTAIDAPVIWGDSVQDLDAGIGTFTGGWMPGFGHTIMLAGHTSTWFSDMERCEVGAIITMETGYGTYTYKVVDMAVKDYEDASAYDFSRTEENIILYTCYPLRQIGFTTERYFVYGEFVSGPVVVDDSGEVSRP